MNRTYAKAPLRRVFKPFDPPQPGLKRGEKTLKVPLFKGDLGGSKSAGEGKKTRPSPPILGGTKSYSPQTWGVGGQINGLCVSPGEFTQKDDWAGQEEERQQIRVQWRTAGLFEAIRHYKQKIGAV